MGGMTLDNLEALLGVLRRAGVARYTDQEVTVELFAGAYLPPAARAPSPLASTDPAPPPEGGDDGEPAWSDDELLTASSGGLS